MEKQTFEMAKYHITNNYDGNNNQAIVADGGGTGYKRGGPPPPRRPVPPNRSNDSAGQDSQDIVPMDDNNNNNIGFQSKSCIDIRDALALTEETAFKVGINRQRAVSYQKRDDAAALFEGYKKNWRLFFISFIYYVLYIAYMWKSLNVISMAYCGILIICIIILLIYGFLRTRRGNVTFIQFFDNLIHGGYMKKGLLTNDTTEVYSIILILVILYACIVTIIRYSYFISLDWDFETCDDAATDSAEAFKELSDNMRGPCLVSYASFWQSYASILFALQLFAYLNVVHKNYEQDLLKFKDNTILNKYESCKNTFDIFISESVIQYKKDKLSVFSKKDRPMFAMLVFIYFGSVILLAIIRFDLYNTQFDFGSFIVFHLIVFCDAIIGTIMTFCAIYIYRTFIIPTIIMNAMANGLLNYIYELTAHGNNNNNKLRNNLIDCIMGWWLLRNYYITCIIHYATHAFSSIIGSALLIGIVLAYFALFLNLWGDTIYTVFFIGVGASLSFAIVLGMASVKYSNAQRHHKNILNKILIQFDLHLCKNIFNSDEIESIENLVNKVQNDIDENVYSMQVAGVSIDTNFMLLLRGGATAIMLALMSELLAS